MKKLILIPGLVMASTLPALTIVSCSKGATASWQLGETLEWKHDNPTFSVKDADEATTEYFNRATAQIIADDYLYDQVSNMPAEMFDEAIMKITINKVDKNEHRLSFTLYTKAKAKETNGSAGKNVEGTVVVKDVPYIVTNAMLNDNILVMNWMVRPVGITTMGKEIQIAEQYWTDKKWSLSVDVTTDGINVKDTINYTIKDELEKHDQAVQQLSNAKFDSYFFKNVTKSEE